MIREYRKIYCCGDCVHYSMRSHKCKLHAVARLYKCKLHAVDDEDWKRAFLSIYMEIKGDKDA